MPRHNYWMMLVGFLAIASTEGACAGAMGNQSQHEIDADQLSWRGL